MVSVDPVADLGRLILRGEDAALDAAGAGFGVAMPRTPCRAESSDGRAALWLGPDEFLLLCPCAEAPPCHAALTAALLPHPHALVDVSDRQLGIRVSGPAAERLLNAGCPMDLQPIAFPINACSRTLLGRAEVTLWRTGAAAFHLEVARSYLPYVRSFLAEARLGLD